MSGRYVFSKYSENIKKHLKNIAFFSDVFTEYSNGTLARDEFSKFIFFDRYINVKVKILKS